MRLNTLLVPALNTLSPDAARPAVCPRPRRHVPAGASDTHAELQEDLRVGNDLEHAAHRLESSHSTCLWFPSLPCPTGNTKNQCMRQNFK